MKGFVVRFNGIEIHIVFGRNITLLGYLSSEDGDHCLGLGLVSVHTRRVKPDKPSVAKARAGSKGKCFICGDAMLEGEPVVPYEPLPIPLFTQQSVNVHAECLVFARHGRVGCQRGLCPDCAPPSGQTIREQARDAEAFYKASNGRPRKGGITS